MIRFDRIKFTTHINNVDTYSHEFFRPREENGRLLYADFHSSRFDKALFPFDLQVKMDFSTSELVIDMGAKILMNLYFEKINRQNIGYCLNRLWTEHLLVKLNVGDILKDAEVLSADVTADINDIELHTKDMNTLKAHTHTNKWESDAYRHGITFTSKMTTRKSSLCIYNKVEELQRPCNAVFLEEASLNHLEQLGSILRVEGKFQSKKDLRIAFGTESTNIGVLLNSNANPLHGLFKSIVDTESFKNVPNSIISEMSMNDFKNYLVVKEARFDELKLRNLLNRHYGGGTNKRNQMRKYRPFLSIQNEFDFSPIHRLLRAIEELVE